MKIKQNHIDYLFKSLILFAVYFITAKFGLKVDAVSGFATLVWLPTGISLAFLLVGGLRFWPAITLAAFLVNFDNGAPLLVATGIGAGNTLEAVIGAFGLKKIGFRIELDRVQDVLKLIFIAALFSTSISALFGTTSLLLGRVITTHDFLNTWSTWWIGDMISDLIIAPLILVWTARPKIVFDPKRLSEEFAMLILLTLTGLIVFGDVFGTGKSLGMYLVFPPLIWIALRFSQRTSVTAIFLLSSIVILSTTLGFEYVPKGFISNELFILQSFMGITAITIMLLSTATIERKELENKKAEFISVASHELKTPITTLKLYTQVLQKQHEKSGNKVLFHSLKKMDEQVNKLTLLIGDLLNVSKMQHGRLQFNKEDFDLSEVVKDAIESIELNSKGHRIVLKGKINRMIKGDRYRIGQVITNLLTNAIKYSPKSNRVIIEIVSKRTSAVVTVRDFGIGIDKEEQKNIFNQFYRVTNPDQRTFPGLGMGLYISNEIIKRHGGKLSVISNKGRGSRFSFTLPYEGSKIESS